MVSPCITLRLGAKDDTTAVVRQSTHPVWNETLEIECVLPDVLPAPATHSMLTERKAGYTAYRIYTIISLAVYFFGIKLSDTRSYPPPTHRECSS